MNPNRFRAVFLAVSLLLFLTGGLYLYNRPFPAGFEVQASRGASGVLGGSVLLPGDTLETGDRVRVGSSALYLEFGEEPLIRTRFSPRSRFRHEGRSLGAGSLELKPETGEGVARVDTGRLLLTFPGKTFLLEHGLFRWRLQPGDPKFERRESTRLFVVRDGETVPVAETNLAVSEAFPRLNWPTNPHPIENYEQYSTLTPGSDVLRSLVNHSTPGEPAESLLDVFGHWVRDRWGNVYLYGIREDRLELRSAGPDERLFTGDDRRWSTQLNR